MPDRVMKVVFVGDAGDAVKAAQDMDRALATVEVRQKSVSAATIATGVALGGVLFEGAKRAASGAVDLATKYADAGSQIHDLAQRTGFSTQALSEWKYAADQSGTSIEGLEVGIKKMNQTVVAANDGAKTQVETLAAIGVNIADLRGKKPEEVFEIITGGLSGVNDEATQAALATELFGKQGTQLLPILKDGAGNIAKMRAEAKALGITFSQEDANAADEFGDAMHKMNMSIEGVKLQIGRELMPVLLPMVDQFGNWIRQNGADVARDLAGGLGKVAEVTKDIAADIGKIADFGPIKVTIDTFVSPLSGDQVGIGILGSLLGYAVAGPKGAIAVGAAAAGGAALDRAAAKGNFITPGELGSIALPALSGNVFGAVSATSDVAHQIAQRKLADMLREAGITGNGEVDPNLVNIDAKPWSPTAAKDPGLGNGGIHTQGGGSTKEDPLVTAWKKINEDMQKEQQKVLADSGLEQLQILRTKQADETASIREMAQRAHDILGIDLDKAVTQAFSDIRDHEKALLDDRIEIAKKATDAVQAQMKVEAELTAQRMKDLQQLQVGLLQGASPGSAFALAFGAAGSGQITSKEQLDAMIAAGNAATNARDVHATVTVKVASSDVKLEGIQ